MPELSNDFAALADAVLNGTAEDAPAPESSQEQAPNAGAVPEGQPGGNSHPGGQAAPEVPAPAPLSPPPAAPAPAEVPKAEPSPAPTTPGIAVGKSVRLIPTDNIDVLAAELKKNNPGMSFHAACDAAREQLGVRPAAPSAPVAPVAAPAQTPAAPETQAAELSPALARMEAIAAEIGTLNPIIDAAEIQQLQIEAMRLQPAAVKEQATLQVQQLMQDQATLTAEQQEAQAAIERAWQTATTTFPTLAQDNSPLREAYEDSMEELRQSTNPADLAILDHPNCEFIVASQCAARLGAGAFAPAAVAQPGGAPAPLTGSPASQTPQPMAQPRPVLPVVPGTAGGDHTQQAGLRAPDAAADLSARLNQAESIDDLVNAFNEGIMRGPARNDLSMTAV